MPALRDMGCGVNRFTKLRAWQACDIYKKAVYRLCEQPPLAQDWKRRDQLEGSVRGPGAHIAEGSHRKHSETRAEPANDESLAATNGEARTLNPNTEPEP